MTEDCRLTIDERLKEHPHLRERFEAIIDIAESKRNGPDTADAVEERAIIEVRKLGKEVIEEWAKQKVAKETQRYLEKHVESRSHKKK